MQNIEYENTQFSFFIFSDWIYECYSKLESLSLYNGEKYRGRTCKRLWASTGFEWTKPFFTLLIWGVFHIQYFAFNENDEVENFFLFNSYVIRLTIYPPFYSYNAPSESSIYYDRVVIFQLLLNWAAFSFIAWTVVQQILFYLQIQPQETEKLDEARTSE